jgi:hypothetical protein
MEIIDVLKRNLPTRGQYDFFDVMMMVRSGMILGFDND